MFAGTTRFSLVSAMTSMLALGLPLEQVVPMVTSHTAQMMAGMDELVGTLKPGVDADVTVLDDERGRWVLQRQRRQRRCVAERMLTPAFCLRARYALRRGRVHPAARQRGLLRSLSAIRQTMTAARQRKGVGASLPRKEDARFLRGRGEYVANIRHGRHAGGRVRALADGACTDRCIEKPAGSGGSRVRRWPISTDVKPIRAVLRPRRIQVFGAAGGSLARQGAPRRRAGRDVRCADARGSRGCRRRRSQSTTKSCPRWSTCSTARTSRRAARARATGATTSFSKRWSTTICEEIRSSAAITVSAASAHRTPVDGAAGRARRGVRWNERLGPARHAHARRRCRTSIAPDSSSAWASTRARSASSRPTSAAASATRASCCRRRSASLARAASSAGPCAGSKTAASSSPRTPTAASTTTTSRCYADARGPPARHRLRGRRSTRAPTRSTRSPPVSKPRR